MGKIKNETIKPLEDFDWSLYENGYNGGAKLVENKNVKTTGRDRVFCHEKYAQELYDIYEKHANGIEYKTKDSVSGTIYDVEDIYPINDHEIIIDSVGGMSSVIDLNKETQYIKSLGYENVEGFMKDFEKNPELKKTLISDNMKAKVIDKKRVSLWEGQRSKVESELMAEVANPHTGYLAHIVDVNVGGYTVDIMGVRCFMPKGLASSGPIPDDEVESLVGTDRWVCVVNYSGASNNFVVSYKKYLEKTLPSRVLNELSVGQEVMVKVTGSSKNGLFCIIRDQYGEFIYTSLMHRSTMSTDAEIDFDNGYYVKGDMFKAFIHKINWLDDGSFRIVIGDKMPAMDENNENEENKEEENNG